ncbi:zinc-binding dehydrogenase [Gordonia sp. ABSL11-1]|uniref:zinc-binding dehydrogenase n=1 Tax=Gordonia sp. ABSL11-1 TaxID=3053924 RepID=UPI002572DDDB|nr:zinc-binding dehydrogenase [Gordonia sp. ABSL11-1]MDL9944087.1 zinc-binding dehydrogenase [Gordonia sp. ABSL11-1]
MQTGYGTVTRVVRPEPGAAVTVSGAGGVGLCSVMAAVRAGADVVAVDPIPGRRASAEKFGAIGTVDPSATDDVAGAVSALHGRGSRHAIDTTARQDVLDVAVSAAEPAATSPSSGSGVGWSSASCRCSARA